MMNKQWSYCVGMCVMMALASCEQGVVEDVMNPDMEQGSARLSVSTRGGDEGGAASVAQGRVYIFNQKGRCVQVLATSEASPSATSDLLPAGTFTIYAVGGPDLSGYSLPNQNEATPTTLISLKENASMADLLMKTQQQTVADGENEQVEIALERKVSSIDRVEIKEVPADVTSVEVVLSSFYSGVQLNGTYPETPTETYSVTLTEQADGKTWLATPQQLVFPSKGRPVFKVIMTNATGTQSFGYEADEALEANHRLNITGTYEALQGVTLTASLTTTEWEDAEDVAFNLDEDHPAYQPVAQQYCNGYYTVSVDGESSTAVLASKSVTAYAAPASGSAASVWQEAINSAMADVEKPNGITNSWRLPTLEEVSTILQDVRLAKLGSSGTTSPLYYQDGSQIKWAYAKYENNAYEIKTGQAFASYIYLWPVIDISY